MSGSLENVIAIAVIVFNIIGIVWLGIRLGHLFLVALVYIIGLVIVSNIKDMFACAYVALIVAAITLVVVIVKIVKAIVDDIAIKRWQKEESRRNSDLLDAVNMGDKDAVQKLIENGADVNYIGYINLTNKSILQIAIENSDKEMISLLIEKGADVNLGNDGKTPLDFVEDDEIITILKEHGAKTKSELDEAKREQAAKMERQNMLNNDLLAAINYHDKERAESLISQGADVNASNVPSFSGYTPLLCAIDGGDIEMVKLLLRHGANANKEAYINGRYVTALQYARGSGKQDIARLLEYS